MKKKKLILASASPRRRELMTQIGLNFTVKPSLCEEKITSTEPSLVVRELSAQKAEDVFSSLSDQEKAENAVIGSDTVVACEGKILGKPRDREDAFAMLSSLAGNTHQVYTGVTLVWEEEGVKKSHTFYEETKVKVASMSKEEIDRYIETGEPSDKAGAYGIQGAFAAFVLGIEGDYNNVVGLPVCRLYQEMKKAGLAEEERGN